MLYNHQETPAALLSLSSTCSLPQSVSVTKKRAAKKPLQTPRLVLSSSFPSPQTSAPVGSVVQAGAAAVHI